MNCEHCQRQLLPYLYDLLEPLERAETATHLEACADCRAALAVAQQQQTMFAEAVKEPNAAIEFKAPVKATPASTVPTVIMHDRPRRRFALFNRWAIAAVILFVFFGVGCTIGWTVWQENTRNLDAKKASLANARDDLSKARDDLVHKKNQTHNEIKAIHGEIDKLFKDWKAAEARERKELKDEGAKFRVNIYGPPYQPGAPNNYEIEIPKDQGAGNILDQNNMRGQQDQLPMQARVISQRNNQKTILYEQTLRLLENNKAQFVVPNTVPIEPDDDVVIEIEARMPNGKVVNLRDNLKIVFPDYVTHLATDRPVYAPGDTVRFRSLTLERFSLKPVQQKFHLRFRILGPKNDEIFRKEVAAEVVAGPKNELVRGPDGAPLLGVGVGEFKLPGELPTGPYTLVVNEVNERFNEERRPFLVQRWQQPRYHKELTFHRSCYGAGDQLRMQVKITPIQGQQPGFGNNLQIYARVVIDGDVPLSQSFGTEGDGRINLECKVPQLRKGVGTVSLRIDDGGQSETFVRDIPLVTRDLTVEFFPEGGDLIAGVPNRVYFQAHSFASRPADIEGRIVDDQEREIARIQTFADADQPGANQGMGSFTFVPEARKRYRLIVDSPIGAERHVPLPEVKEHGVAMSVLDDVATNEINVALMSTEQRRWLVVGAYCRGRMVAYQAVRAGAYQPVNVALKPMLDVGGVYRITVFEKAGTDDDIAFRPIAERLVYRKSTATVNVEAKSNAASHLPGDTVRLMLQARNENKVLTPTVALVAVVDSGLMKSADARTARSMPTHFLLTTEIRNPEDLEHADFFLSDHPNAPHALDLLLGCQGWRRFAEQDPQKFVLRQKQQQQQAKAPPFMGNSVNFTAQNLDAEPKGLEKLDGAYVRKAIDMQMKLSAMEATEEGPQEMLQKVQSKVTDLQSSQSEVSIAEERLRAMRIYLIQFVLGGALLTLLFLGFYLVSMGLRRLSEGEGRPRRWFLAGFGLLGFLFAASIIGTIAFMNDRTFDDFMDVRPPFGGGFGGMAMPDRAWNDVVAEPPPLELPEVDEPIVEPDVPKQQFQRQNEGNIVNPIWQRDNPIGLNDLKQLDDVAGPGAVPVPPLDEERRLRQEGNFAAILVKHMNRRVELPPVRDPSIVREYAHRRGAKQNDERAEPAPTIFWQPVLVMPDGKAEVTFDLADAVTRYDVLILSHTFDGRIGANRSELTAKLPVAVNPRVPAEISDKDKLTIPVDVANNETKANDATLWAKGKGLQLTDNTARDLKLKANEKTRQLWQASPSVNEGAVNFRMNNKSQGLADTVERRLNVVHDGFPVTGSFSGVIEGNAVEHTINLPGEWVRGTLKVQVHFYPSPLAEIHGALEALEREPAACFEQVASSTSANALVLQYLKMPGSPFNPMAEKQARKRLQAGLPRLGAFECQDPADKDAARGFDWFAHGAANDAMTALGLVQLRTMAKVYYVDGDLLDRTDECVRNRRDQLGTMQPAARAYALWALTANGQTGDLTKELAALRKQAMLQRDPYVLALAAVSHENAKRRAEAGELLKEIAALQNPEGVVAGAKTSITGSQGRDLDVETTALAVLGWLHAERGFEFNANIQSGIKWLHHQRRGAGNYGGTQATLLALQAMLANYKTQQDRNPRLFTGGEVRVTMLSPQAALQPGDAKAFDDGNGGPTNVVPFSQRSQERITVTLDNAQAFQPGANRVQLAVTNNNMMPYTLTWSYRTTKTANDPKAPIKLSAKLDKTEAREGDAVKLSALVENASGKAQGMTVAVFGLPAGVSLPDDAAQVKLLAGAGGKVDAWEIRGRELVLYWRNLPAGATIPLELDLTCRLPGVYRGPASRAYLVYDGAQPFWVEPLPIRIAAK